MKVIACTILFYGEEYMEASIKSVAPFVDKIVILYTSKPSQGYGMDLKSPDDGEEMKRIALAASDKVEWVDVTNENIINEGEHRNIIYRYTDGYSVLMWLDADEVHCPIDLPRAISECYNSNIREHGVDGFIHFWRSFDYRCLDWFRPIRFINLKVPFVSTDPKGEIKCKIYHTSYFQRERTMRFKFNTSGHHSEVRDNYLDEVYYAWTPQNDLKYLHPCSMGCWLEAVPFDRTTIPQVLKEHPNYKLNWNDKH